MVDLYATSGPIRVRDGESIAELQAPAHLALLTGRRERAIGCRVSQVGHVRVVVER